MTALKSKLFTSITLSKQQAVEAEWSVEIDKKGTRDNCSLGRNAQPLPAWLDMWEKLKRPIMEVTSVGALSDAKRSKAFLDAFSDQGALDRAVDNALKGIQKRVRITGLSLKWKDREELVGCVVSAIYVNEKGESMAINTPYIHLSRDTYGFEADLHETIIELIEATEGYLGGEYTQLDLFSGEDAKAAKEKPAKADKKAKGTKQLEIPEAPPRAAKPAKKKTAAKAA